MAVKIIDFRKYEQNTLRGFFTVLLEPSGLEIRDLTLHQKGERRWVNFPARSYQDSEGNTQYAYVVFFPDKERSNQFQRAVLKALGEFQPPEPTQEDIENGKIPF